MGKRCGRTLAFFAVLALASSLFVSTAPPASAALHSPIPADESGDPTDFFTDDSALFAYVLSDIRGGYICIVGADADAGGGCGAGKHFVLGIGTQYVLVSPGPLSPGTYRLKATDSQNGSGELSIPFTVVACDTCDRRIAQAAVDEAKAAATQMLPFVGGTCVGFGVQGNR